MLGEQQNRLGHIDEVLTAWHSQRIDHAQASNVSFVEVGDDVVELLDGLDAHGGQAFSARPVARHTTVSSAQTRGSAGRLLEWATT